MKESLDIFKKYGAKILVISFDDVEAVQRFKKLLDLPFDFASDASREAYKNYGLTEGSNYQVWHPRTILTYLKLTFLRGMKVQKPKNRDELSQLGGDFLLNSDGIMVFKHRSRRPDDRPKVRKLIRALESIKMSG